MKVRPHPLFQQRQAVGQADQRRAPHQIVALPPQRYKRVGQLPFPRRHHRVILHHVLRVGRHRVDAHPPAHHRDCIIAAQRRLQKYILHVVHKIHFRRRVGARPVEIKSLGNAVAHKHLPAVQVADDQVQVVHQFDPRTRIARRIRPHQRHPQRLQLRIARKRQLPVVPLARGNRIARALIEKPQRPRRFITVTQPHGQAVGQTHQTPALQIDRVGHAQIVIRVHRTRPVDQQRLHQGRTEPALEPLLEKLLHQRQHPAHPRRRHARARLVSIIRTQIRHARIQIVRVHVLRSRRYHKRPRRHHVRLEPPKIPFAPDAHVAPAGK